MNPERPDKVSVIDPISPAIERVKLMLFRPFDLQKWLVIGFCAWLAYLGAGGGGGGGGGGGSGGPGYRAPHAPDDAHVPHDPWRGMKEGIERAKDYVLDNSYWIIPLAVTITVLVIVIGLLIAWLNSRGRFMFLHCVATNKAEVRVPWTKFRKHGNSLFLFRIVLGLIGLAVVGVPVIAIIALVIMLASGALVAVASIAGIIILAFAFGHGSLANFTESGPLIAAGSSSVFFLFIMAMAGAFWAYDGWIMLTYLSGEIKNVQKNLPRALAITVVIIIALYVLMNLAYIYIIPVSTMARNYSEGYLVAVDVANRFLGDWGGGLIAIAIMISTFGAVNGTTMMPARITFAMAREKVFFRRLGDVHPRYRTPGKSLIVLGIWTSILVLTGTFDQLTNTMVFVSWIFYALASISVFTLRKKMPDTPRPYKVWGYPVTPIVFILFASVYIVFTLYSDIVSFRNGATPIINSVMGLFWLAIGIPGYFYWSRKQKRERN